MEQIKQVISQMIDISESEMNGFLKFCFVKTFKRREALSKPNCYLNELFFINKGIARVTILDQSGTEHTTHFALENNFIADYTSFILKQPAFYTLEAIEETEKILQRSFNYRMVADVPVGSYLSGGMDSGSITAIASTHVRVTLL